ncbi:hypothetical protein [Clostridium sp. BJN0013]|uniref:hypothetical protein n=1 Tax=Clostridium sp. BJN0013 TaxID=3236840 RepID=UPI0034C654BA
MSRTKYKLLSAVMLATPLLLNTGIATTVSAHPINNGVQPVVYRYNYTFANFQTKLNALVTAGVITQSQETIILNLYYSGQITTRSTFKAQLDALVAAGTITQGQEYSILNVFTGWGTNWELPAPPNEPGHNGGSPNGSEHNHGK